MPSPRFRFRAYLAFALTLFLFTLLSKGAFAYPWMIRHEYTGCIQCHVDPAGGGLLTEYGRGQGETVLRMQYGGPPAQEPGAARGFLWGAFDLPDWLLLGGSFRPAGLYVKVGDAAVSGTAMLMEADLRAGVRAGGFRMSTSLGVTSIQGSLAAVVGPVVSREHWAGFAWNDDAFLIRAGRMNLPFGIRSIEHPLWVRSSTRTNINDAQDHGVAFDYSGAALHGSVMAILGNYQIAPDAFRERGYVGYLEWAPALRFAVGASSLVAHAAKDIDVGVPNTRQSHGLYLRASPWTPLVIMAEGDLIANSIASSSTSPAQISTSGPPVSSGNSFGGASMVQADVEPIQGLHLIATGESRSPGDRGSKSSYGAWASVHWFFASHADLRFDFMYRSMAEGNAIMPVTSYVVQLHIYL